MSQAPGCLHGQHEEHAAHVATPHCTAHIPAVVLCARSREARALTTDRDLAAGAHPSRGPAVGRGVTVDGSSPGRGKRPGEMHTRMQ
jgi:hypothetical protein